MAKEDAFFFSRDYSLLVPWLGKEYPLFVSKIPICLPYCGNTSLAFLSSSPVKPQGPAAGSL